MFGRLLATCALLGLAACNGGPDDSDDTQLGACGAISTHDLVIEGRVTDSGGSNVSGAAVELEDRGWEPGTILGTATTDTGGRFSLAATGVTSVEDCWGSLLEYMLVATEGTRTGELWVNHPMYNAIDDGSFDVELFDTPIEIQ